MTHLVHGLAGDDVAPDWPRLTQEDVCRVLEHFRLAPLKSIRWHSPRPLSSAAIVDTGDGALFIKRHDRRVRDVAGLSEEHRFASFLREAGLPVPRVMADARGHSVFGDARWTYEIHTLATGEDRYREAISWSPVVCPEDAFALGAMLARLHRVAARFVAPRRTAQVLMTTDDSIRADDPVASLQGQLDQRPALAAYLHRRAWQDDFARVLLPWHEAAGRPARQLPPLWAHNDWHASNLCWRTSSAGPYVSDILDFGLASPTSAMFDLATAIERNAIAWLQLDRTDDIAHADTAIALIAGYRSEDSGDRLDLPALTALLPLVHIDFALSEIEYFEVITRTPASSDVAYDAFLLGHAAWFARPSGHALLATLRDAA